MTVASESSRAQRFSAKEALHLQLVVNMVGGAPAFGGSSG